jgi:hypothetical protein
MTNSHHKLPFHIPDWVLWVAQDRSGIWWGYSVEPLRSDNGWYENEVGNHIELGETSPDKWQQSLRKVS